MRIFILSFLLGALSAHADTMDHYMNISNSIPQMEMKADPQAQAWARSARNVLVITDESIAETLMQANELAKGQGQPLFCLPQGATLNAITLNGIILETYRNISSQQSDKDKMTVSQVAWLGVTKKYPCQPDTHGKQMEHVAALMTH
ncbi:hypothetical protein [Legionella brunensis]|uniref:Phosphatase n=1 Tax=Legionella brunensis TaxID=29422 RepID=A0A0W0S4B7_9GAMM|nr:hypothetical protein [Legionella brunensis]KTC78186.1 phosphatase [Legionella brunensis]